MKWTPVATGAWARWRATQPPRAEPYFTVEEDTHFGVWQRQREFIDRALMARILPHVPRGTIAIDGGAFNGEHAIAYSEVSSLVFAFEPQLPAFLNLCTNVFLGQHGNVIPERAALGNAAGAAHVLAWDGSRDNYGARRARPALLPSPYDVPVIALDQHLATQCGRVGFIKLDVEGWELEALAGAHATIARDRPTLWVEVNEGTLADRGSSARNLLEWITALGYQIQAGTGGMGEAQWDALCVPSST